MATMANLPSHGHDSGPSRSSSNYGDTPTKSANPRKAKRKLKGVGAWLLWSYPPAKGDPSPMLMVRNKEITSKKPTLDLPMTNEQRLEERNVTFKDLDGIYAMHFFARIEVEARPEDVDDGIQKTLERFQQYMTELNLSSRKAYEELVKTFPERMYAGFSYPDLKKPERYTQTMIIRGKPVKVSDLESATETDTPKTPKKAIEYKPRHQPEAIFLPDGEFIGFSNEFADIPAESTVEVVKVPVVSGQVMERSLIFYSTMLIRFILG
jgi:hypothetical protein